MERYRIEKQHTYSGCIPVTVHTVQVLHDGRFCDTWVNVKGYEDYNKAKKLLEILKGEIKL
jgi:hypothetical protein